MKTIKDPKFIGTIARRFARCPLPPRTIDGMRVEISGNSGVGLRVNICDRKQSVIELGWHRNGAWSVSSIKRFEHLEHCDHDALSRCVRAFLNKHDLVDRDGCSTIEYDKEIATLLRMIAAMGDAVKAGEWTKAREMWDFLSPLHAGWIAVDPSLAHIRTVLLQNEALTQRQSGSTIH